MSSVIQSCLILMQPTDCSPPGSSVSGIFQARTLEWVAISTSRESSWPKDWTWVFCIAGGSFTAQPLILTFLLAVSWVTSLLHGEKQGAQGQYAGVHTKTAWCLNSDTTACSCVVQKVAESFGVSISLSMKWRSKCHLLHLPDTKIKQNITHTVFSRVPITVVVTRVSVECCIHKAGDHLRNNSMKASSI